MTYWEERDQKEMEALPPASQSAKALQALGIQMAKDFASVMGLAIHFAAQSDGITGCSHGRTYVSANQIAADEVASIVDRFEKQQPQLCRDKRRRQRAAALRTKIRSDLEWGRELKPSVEWTVETVLEFARMRRDVLGLAIACIEQERDDADDSVLRVTADYLSGELAIFHVRAALGKIGITTESNVVPLVPLRRTGK